MKKLKTSIFLVCALGMLMATSSVNAQEVAGGSDGQAVRPAEPAGAMNSGLVHSSSRTAEMGGWFWGLLADPALSSGATAVTSDLAVPSTIYVGGPGYIAVSFDSGANWVSKVQFDVPSEDEDEAEGAGNGISFAGVGGDQRVESMREYLRHELEDQFGTDYANDLIEEMTEEELLSAKDVSDIEVLKDLPLEMDSDLSQVLVDVALAGVGTTVFDSFPSRYIKYLHSGADADTAVEYASQSPSVQSFSRTSTAVYAVTSKTIYMTTDRGETWQVFMQVDADDAILSFDISQDGSIVLVGLANGLMMTRNAGADWVQLTDVFNGAVFESHISEAAGHSKMVVLSTDGIYQSLDLGLTWQKVELLGHPTEFVTSVVSGAGDRMLALTDSALYMTQDGKRWLEVQQGPFPDEQIEQVIAKDSNLDTFLVRTASRIFEYTPNGWLSQNKSLMAGELGALAYMRDGVSLALMASPSGVWMAQDAQLIEVTGEYKTLHDVWRSEPTDDEVIHEALEAHYLGDMLEKRWGLRSRLSWLLPQVTFDYIFRQTPTSNPKLTYTLTGDPSADLASLNYKLAEDYNYKFEARNQWQIMARWSLNIEKGLKDEIASDRIMMRLRSDRARIIKQVMADLKKRRALQVAVIIDMPRKSGRSKSSLKKAVKTYLGLSEVEARLHYMTGGYYIPAVRQHDNKI